MRNTIVALSVLALSAFGASTAHAQEASVHVQGGPAQVFHSPDAHPDYVFSRNQFRTGAYGAAELELHLTPWLGVGPRAAVQYFTPSNSPNAEASVLWDFDGAVRLSCPDAAKHGWRPYVSANGGVDKHGSVWNPQLGGQLGVDFALESSKTYWLGVYVGYDHVFQTNTAGERQSEIMNHHDVNTGSVGLSLAFDYPVKPVHEVRVETKTVVQTVPGEARVVVRLVPVPVGDNGPRLVESESNVAFDKDSAVLSDEGKKLLDGAADKLKAHPEVSVDVEGHASSEGPFQHNWDLARDRALAIKAYLVSKGVKAENLTPASFGPTGGSEDNDLKGNRRVNFVVHLPAQN